MLLWRFGIRDPRKADETIASQTAAKTESERQKGRDLRDAYLTGALDAYLAEFLVDADARPSVLASSFSASLELARQGQVELRQSAAFGPLLLRRRSSDA